MSNEKNEIENIFATAKGKIIDSIEKHEGVLRIIFTNKDTIDVKFEIKHEKVELFVTCEIF
jgi:hypothetical protein